MNRYLIVSGIVILLLAVGFSGCTELENKFNEFVDDELTIEELMSTPKVVSLEYSLNGESWEIDYEVYKGLNDYLSDLPREISYYDTPPTTKDFIMKEIDNEYQREFLLPLVDVIRDFTSDTDNQARVSISIVQNIDYDYSGLEYGYLYGKYPYEVLYTESGVCGEKSDLLAFLLRELGFSVAVFEFDNHRAVGISCNPSYDYKNTGYCFIESTTPSIITYSEGDYIGTGKLSNFELIPISGGMSLQDISEEYNDAQEYDRLNNLADSSGGILSELDYNRWLEIVNKYGIHTE